jgi:hypothetical protein
MGHQFRARKVFLTVSHRGVVPAVNGFERRKFGLAEGVSFVRLSRLKSRTSRGLRSVDVRLRSSPACASLSMEAMAVECDWNRCDMCGRS